MRRLLPIVVLALGLLFQAPALAAATPALAEALSSARAGVGNVITDGNGRPVWDAHGMPLRVTGVETASMNQTVASLALAMRVPVADFLAYAQRLGMTLPILMPGTLTQVTRSDGGIEQVFVFKAHGAEYAFMADKTGSNCFGIRMAHVDATGKGAIMTAHGLNGNFTHPPAYLSEEAKRDYWIAWDDAQILSPPATLAKTITGVSSLGTGGARGNVRVGDHQRLQAGQTAVMTDPGALLGLR